MRGPAIFFFLVIILLMGCDNRNEKLTWLSADKDSAYVQIERHFRGFDLAMKEVGYRYNELYWAGNDENWGYAEYHLQKIQLAIENGLERRPKRAASAQSFLNHSIPALMEKSEARDRESFLSEFEAFRQACNTCHISEQVAFIEVVIPAQRLSPVKSNSEK